MRAGPADGRPVAVTSRKPWQDPDRPVDDRVADLLARMTLEEKVAQLYAVWAGADGTGDQVAPFQHDLVDGGLDWAGLITAGLGQLTRPFGSAPVDPALGARWLGRKQAEIVAAGRFGIPALAHEECLTGLMAWGATAFPTPLAWAATFDPELIERMAAAIGRTLRALGIHQGLAPIVDVVRDPRWGRTEETAGEDPYLVGTVGTAYVRGLQSAGVVATLKHFAGYAGSRAGRNFAPVAIGPRELADVVLPPFEMAVRLGGAASVMHSYAEIDGVPPGSDDTLLTGLLRDAWGFTGTVVADYFAIAFLHRLHGVAASPADAAVLAIAAGVDVELPMLHCYGEPLLAACRAGIVPEALVDRAARRVLRQKCELGLLDPDWSPQPAVLAAGALSDSADPGSVSGTVDLDPPADRALAREIAEKSVVLLANDGILPLRPGVRVALVGPAADDPMAMLGCYTFPSHRGLAAPGIDVPTVLHALAAEPAIAAVEHAAGCDIDGADRSGFAAALAAAGRADVCVAVLGDRAGLFGRGTSGEGCDVEDLALPGVQGDLLDALLGTGTPVVAVLLTGRPYALGRYADRTAAIVQAFFPGEEGGPAVVGVLSGRVDPSGRLPVSMPRSPGGQPWTYLAPPLGHATDVSTVDPGPLFAFGHGLSYTSFSWTDPTVDPAGTGTDGAVSVSVAVRNTGDRAGTEVVQLYLHDPVAQVTRPVVRLIGYARVRLEPGAARRVTFGVPADLAAFTGRAGRRVVEPGDLELRLSASAVDVRHAVRVTLTGPERTVDHRRALVSTVEVTGA